MAILLQITNSDFILQLMQNTISSFARTIPALLGGIILLIIGYLIAKIIQLLLQKVLQLLPLKPVEDKVNEIEIFRKMNFELRFAKAIPTFVFYSILFVISISAFEIMGLNILSSEMGKFIAFIPRIFTAIVILIIGTVISDFIKKVVQASCESFNIPSAKLIANFAFYFLFITFLITALEQAGLNTDIIKSNVSIIIGGIVLAFAVSYGVASRYMMSNILTSFYNKNKVNVGDHVKIGNHEGTVIEIDNTSIILLQNNNKIIIPLHQLSHETVTIFPRNLN